MTLQYGGVVIPPWSIGGTPIRARKTTAPFVVALCHPLHRDAGSRQLRIQLDQLRAEAEATRSKANAARLRLMRLTEAAENLRSRAAMSIQVGKETEARELLIQKKKLMQALKKSKNRIEVLDKLSSKINEAISLKETQLIGQVAIQPEDNISDSCGQIHFVSPKEDTVEMVDSSEGFHEHILENIDMQLKLLETDIENFLRSQSVTEETKQKQMNEKLEKLSEILKHVLSIRESNSPYLYELCTTRSVIEQPISLCTSRQTNAAATSKRAVAAKRMLLCRFTVPPPRPRPLVSRLNLVRRCSSLLHRQWMLPSPAAPIHSISLSSSSYSSDLAPVFGGPASTVEVRDFDAPFFYLIRDDLLHPLVNGNKARKLDALVPLLRRHSATDLVTCGGCQSAHAAAVAVCCAERGLRAHLLLRGEQPEVPTGYNLVSLMYGSVNYVERSTYARREEMLLKHAESVAGGEGNVLWVDDILKNSNGLNLEESDSVPMDGRGDPLSECSSETSLRRVVIVNEGACSVVGLLGIIRLVKYLSQAHVFGRDQQIVLVLDSGTGTTAIGLALGIIYFGLPWRITAVTLADSRDWYKEREKCLISNFKSIYGLETVEHNEGIIHWVDRLHPRRFGKVLNGEIDLCRRIAQQTGVLLDPIYTLAAWEHAVLLADAEAESHAKVVMLHTGGTLGLFGLAQRYVSDFRSGVPTVHTL
ncbi:unnamed protein product [Musa hybrid cultivar]